MIIVRATTDVLSALRRRGARIVSDPPASTSVLGDWYAKLVRMRHGTWVVAIAEKTCLPIVVTGRELRAFPQRLTETLMRLLDELAVPSQTRARERVEMVEIQFARTNSRSHLGVLNRPTPSSPTSRSARASSQAACSSAR